MTNFRAVRRDGSNGRKTERGTSPRDLRLLVRTDHTPTLAALSAIVLSFGVALNGLNNAFGNPLLFVLCGGLLGLLLIAAVPTVSYWTRVAPIVGLVLAAYLWAVSPLWAPDAVSDFSPHYAAPDLVLPELLGAAGLLSAFLAGTLLAGRRGAIPIVCDWLLALACANVLLGLLLRELGDPLPLSIWQSRPGSRFTGTLSNANVAGAYFGMIAIVALGRITGARGNDRNEFDAGKTAARSVGLLLCAGACAITASRSAFVGMVAGLLTIAVLQLVRRKGGRRALLTALAVVIGIAAVFAAGLAELLLSRFDLVAEESTGRTVMWTQYWELARQSPWLGYGPGGFPSVSLRGVDDPRLAQLLWTVNSPHNLFLQLMLKGGVVFMVLMVATALLVSWRIAKNFRQSGARQSRVGMALAIVLALACSMVDIALDVPAIAALTLFLAGLLWGRSQYGPQDLRRLSAPRASVA